MASKLFVGSLSWGTTSQALEELFSQAGTVVSAQVISDRFTGKSKGFGFVEMASEEEAQAAIEKFNNTEFDGRTIVVNIAKPQVPRENRGGGNRGGFRDNRGGGNRW